MARQKEFNQNKALERAMEYFWAHGYEGSSMQGLLDAMELNRGSLYDTFGDKHSLYLQAVRHYIETAGDKLDQCMSQAPSLRDAIKGMLSQSCGNKKGCFMTNAAAELAFSDPEVKKILSQHFARAEKRLEQLIIAAQERGEVPAYKDAAAIAAMISSLMQGLIISNKVKRCDHRTGSVIDLALGVLD